MNSDLRIIYPNGQGGIAVLIPAPGVSFERLLQDVPPQYKEQAQVIFASEQPSCRMFRGAWRAEGSGPGTTIVEDVDVATEIAHGYRRQLREAEFAPLDKQATIPMFAEAAEQGRQAVREKYAEVQVQIDAAESTDELRSILAAVQE